MALTLFVFTTVNVLHSIFWVCFSIWKSCPSDWKASLSIREAQICLSSSLHLSVTGEKYLPHFQRTFSVEHRALVLPFSFHLEMSSLQSSGPQSFTLSIRCVRGQDRNRDGNHREVSLNFSCLPQSFFLMFDH